MAKLSIYILLFSFVLLSYQNCKLRSSSSEESFLTTASSMSDTQSHSIINSEAEKTLMAWYMGKADLQFVRNMPSGAGSAWIAVHEGRWYLYDRANLTDMNNQPVTRDFCQHHGAPGHLIATTVRVSSDKGQTWSAPQFAAWPSGESGASDACQVLDGATFYDKDTDLWHMWNQCLGNVGQHWKMCHYTSSSPMGPFEIHQQATVDNGEIWNQICAQFPQKCNGSISDEGTPEILFKQGDYFYVSFHGFRPSTGEGFRGFARTADFINFQVNHPSLPQGPSLSSSDCRSWNPGCIGFGASSTLITQNLELYTLSEAPTLSLICSPGQNWHWGLMRGRLNTQSQLWNQSISNPIIQGNAGVECSVAYARMFADGNDIYVFYSRFSQPNLRGFSWKLYKLQKTQEPENNITTPNLPNNINNGNSNSGGNTNTNNGNTSNINAPGDNNSSHPNPTYQKVIHPLMDYHIGASVFKNAAWIGHSQSLGDRYCQLKFGNSWRVDMNQSQPHKASLNICNVKIDMKPDGSLYCERGIGGSNYNGFVFESIICFK